MPMGFSGNMGGGGPRVSTQGVATAVPMHGMETNSYKSGVKDTGIGGKISSAFTGNKAADDNSKEKKSSGSKGNETQPAEAVAVSPLFNQIMGQMNATSEVHPMAQQLAYNVMANQQPQMGQPMQQQQPSLLMQQAQANPQLTQDLAQRAMAPQVAETTVRPDKGFGKIIMIKHGEGEA